LSQSPRNLSPGFFRNSPEALKHVNHVRHWAGRVAHLPFGGEAIVQACAGIDQAGVSRGHLLSATARDYLSLKSIDHIVATLAGRVGNPEIPPTPPLWPLLAVLLLGWGETTSIEGVLRHSNDLGVEAEAYRGLAMVVYLFPELRVWAADVHRKIPLWERAFALPLAARKLVQFEQAD